MPKVFPVEAMKLLRKKFHKTAGGVVFLTSSEKSSDEGCSCRGKGNSRY